LYLNGEDHDLGMSMLKIAAEQGNHNAQASFNANQGDVDAQISMGIRYSTGQGVEKDNVVAVKWFTKAVEQGSSDAQCFLGDMYAKGLGVIKDEVKAANLISMAAKQGHPEAQAYLGDMYWSGQGVKQDTEQAIHWLRLAAKQGQDGAADKLEEILESERKNSLTKPRSKSN
jgi:TPR repeat protein